MNQVYRKSFIGLENKIVLIRHSSTPFAWRLFPIFLIFKGKTMEKIILLLSQVIPVYNKTSLDVHYCWKYLVEVILPKLSEFVVSLESLN